MTVELQKYIVSHCIICDENPAAKGDFSTQLNNLSVKYMAKITWRRCRLCKVQDATQALIEVEKPLI